MTQEHFNRKVKISGSCWLWLGALNKDGYGKLGVGPRKFVNYWLAHRYAYFLVHGEIPKGFSVLHKCDTPACVRIDHLFLGTQSDNMKDMALKKRSKKGRPNPHAPLGVEHGMSRLREHDVLAIRKAANSGVIQKNLAQKYDISVQHISDIVNHKRWKHI